jgi:uncharacterized membrane protein
MEGENTTNQNTNQSAEPVQTAHTTPVGSTPAVGTTGEKKTLMAVLAYIGILIIIPYLTSKEDPFVKFHIKQGLVLVVIELIIYVLGMMMWVLMPILGVINIAVVILSIIGIINVVQGNEKELPLVGPFSKHFNI